MIAAFYVEFEFNLIAHYGKNITWMSIQFSIDVRYLIILIIFLGTLFTEIWKRKNAVLAYQWDVDNFQDTEPDRPQFFGTSVKPVSIMLFYILGLLVIHPLTFTGRKIHIQN